MRLGWGTDTTVRGGGIKQGRHLVSLLLPHHPPPQRVFPVLGGHLPQWSRHLSGFQGGRGPCRGAPAADNMSLGHNVPAKRKCHILKKGLSAMQGEQWGSAPEKGGGSWVIFRLETCPATLTSFPPPSTSWAPFPSTVHTGAASWSPWSGPGS